MRQPTAERNKLWGVELPPENPRQVVRADWLIGFNYVQQIDENSCWFHGLLNIDPKFAYLPDWLLNFTIKRAVYVMVGSI